MMTAPRKRIEARHGLRGLAVTLRRSVGMVGYGLRPLD
jgi:hypothetical protein